MATAAKRGERKGRGKAGQGRRINIMWMAVASQGKLWQFKAIWPSSHPILSTELTRECGPQKRAYSFVHLWCIHCYVVDMTVDAPKINNEYALFCGANS